MSWASSPQRVCPVAGTGGAVKIKLRAPVVEGKANAALVRFLAKQMKLPRHVIVLLRGHNSRDKLIGVDGLNQEDVRHRLLGNRDELSAIP